MFEKFAIYYSESKLQKNKIRGTVGKQKALWVATERTLLSVCGEVAE